MNVKKYIYLNYKKRDLMVVSEFSLMQFPSHLTSSSDTLKLEMLYLSTVVLHI